MTIDPRLAPPWHTTSATGAGVGGGLGDTAGLGDGLSAIVVGIEVACEELGDGDRAASDPCDAPTPHALTQKITSARPASRPILEG
jgi:hypothetical protein